MPHQATSKRIASLAPSSFRLVPKWIAALLVAVPCLLSTSVVSAQPDRQQVPSEAILANDRKLVAQIYESDLAAAKSTEQRHALAKRMMSDASKSTNSVSERYVLYEFGRNAAIAAGDLDLAIDNCDVIAKEFDILAAPLKYEVLTTAHSQLRTPTDYYFWIRNAEHLVVDLKRTFRWSEAQNLVRLADLLAKKSREPDVSRQWDVYRNELQTLETVHKATASALVELEEMPADATLNDKAGKLYCFVVEDWSQGISMLALGEDQVLQPLAKQELQLTGKPDELVALAQKWTEVAEGRPDFVKRAILRHAYELYRNAHTQLEGLVRAKVHFAMNDIAGQAMPARFPLSKLSPTSVLPVWLYNQGVYKTIPVAGKKFRDSIWAHPPPSDSSRITFDIPAGSKYLIGACGFHDIPDDFPHNTVVFSILGDGATLWKSPATKELNKATPFKVSLSGVKKIELQVHCNGFNGASHAAWLDPILQR